MANLWIIGVGVALAVFTSRVAVGTGRVAATPPFLFVYAAAPSL